MTFYELTKDIIHNRVKETEKEIINEEIRNQFQQIMNTSIDYIKLVGYECPKKYPTNNWLRMHGGHTIPRDLRKKRNKEIRNYHNTVSFKIIEEQMDKIFPVVISDNFHQFVDVKDIGLGDANLDWGGRYEI